MLKGVIKIYLIITNIFLINTMDVLKRREFFVKLRELHNLLVFEQGKLPKETLLMGGGNRRLLSVFTEHAKRVKSLSDQYPECINLCKF